jgi:hypothetical protein
MKPPERRVCALCGHDDEVAIMPSPDGGSWQYTCPPGPHHAELHVWTVAEPTTFIGRDGVTAEFGLYDDLPALVVSGEPWVEYGLVEHRYKLAHPQTYNALLDRYGHRAKQPKPFTMSAFIAGALGQLAREGVLAYKWGPATGYWSYNGKVSYWAVPPAPAESRTVTWKEFADGDPSLDASAWRLDMNSPE